MLDLASRSAPALQMKDWFRVDGFACARLPSEVTPAFGFHTKADLYTLLGCYAWADNTSSTIADHPRRSTACSFLLPSQSALLSTIGVRPASTNGYTSRQYTSLQGTIARLAGTAIGWDYRVHRQQGARRVQTPRAFSAALLTWTVPTAVGLDERIESRAYAAAVAAYRGRARHVTLNLYDGAARSYYVLVSKNVFLQRRCFSASGLRLLLWLYLQHRGSRKRRTEVRVRASRLIHQVLAWKKAHRRRERAELEALLNHLRAVGVLSEIAIDGNDVLSLRLGAAYFHGLEPSATGLPKSGRSRGNRRSSALRGTTGPAEPAQGTGRDD